VRFNSVGSAATGVGAGVIGVNGTTPAGLVGILGGGGSQHGPSWLTNDEIVFQSLGLGGVGPAVLGKYKISTATLTTLDASPNNDCAAGNGIWGLYLASNPTLLKSNNGIGSVSGAGLGDVAQDFGELVKINTFPNAIGLTVYSITGTVLLSKPQNVLTNGTIRIRGHVVSFQNQGAWLLERVVPGALTYAARIQESINWITPLVLANGDVLLLERSDRLTLRYAASGTGWEIMAAGSENTFNPDLVEVSAGVIRIGWCINQGESPASLHLAEITPATNAIRYASSFTAGVPNFGALAAIARVTFPVGPAGVTSNGGSSSVSAARLNVPYQEPVTDPNPARKGLISRPYYDLLQAHSDLLKNLGDTVSAIPPTSSGSPGTVNLTGTSGPLTLGKLLAGNDGVDVVATTTDRAGAQGTLLGRTSASAGDWQAISLSPDLQMALTTLGLADTRRVLRYATVTISDATIKALPTNGQLLVAAPGAGFRISFVQVNIEIKVVGAYTNVDLQGWWTLVLLGGGGTSNFIGNDQFSTPVLTSVTDMLVTNPRSLVSLLPFTQEVAPTTFLWGNTSVPGGTNFDNLPLFLYVQNGTPSVGNYTGGNAGNSAIFHVYYLIEPTIP
jgi:hypothetical protein